MERIEVLVFSVGRRLDGMSTTNSELRAKGEMKKSEIKCHRESIRQKGAAVIVTVSTGQPDALLIAEQWTFNVTQL